MRGQNGRSACRAKSTAQIVHRRIPRNCCHRIAGIVCNESMLLRSDASPTGESPQIATDGGYCEMCMTHEREADCEQAQ